MLLLEEATPKAIQRGSLSPEASKHGHGDFTRIVVDNETLTTSIPDLRSAVERSLHEAANRGYHEIVRLLLAHSAKGKYRSLWVPFRVASRGGYEPTPNTVGPDVGIASED